MNTLARGPIPLLGTGILMAASTLQVSPVVVASAAVTLLFVLIAARWPGSWAAPLAVVTAAFAVAVGTPSPPAACATGFLALTFLLAGEARRTLAGHADLPGWLRHRSRLLLGGLAGIAAALVGDMWTTGSPWLAAAGVLALGGAYLLAVRPLAPPQ